MLLINKLSRASTLFIL